MKKRSLPLVIVEWLDANTASGWTELNEIKEKPTLVKTVGWLLKKSETCLVVFSSYTEDGAFGEVTTIPAPWVQTVKKLRTSKLSITEGD